MVNIVLLCDQLFTERIIFSIVPCLQRVLSYQLMDSKEEVVNGDEEWVATHLGFEERKKDPIPDAQEILEENKTSRNETQEISDDIPDLEDFSALEQDDGALSSVKKNNEEFEEVDHPNSNILTTRTYDLHITYDRYYQTPRVWLFGYDEVNLFMLDKFLQTLKYLMNCV